MQSPPPHTFFLPQELKKTEGEVNFKISYEDFQLKKKKKETDLSGL